MRRLMWFFRLYGGFVIAAVVFVDIGFKEGWLFAGVMLALAFVWGAIVASWARRRRRRC